MKDEEICLREKKGKIASIVGVLANIFLAGTKIAVGLIFGFISVLADGLNNLSDSGSSLVSFVSFKLSSKPADKEHPYGHQRIEYVASMIVSFLILLIAFELLTESISKIIKPEDLEFSYIIVLVLVLSILVKFGMFFYYRSVANKINSDILKATSADSISDCVSTTAVLIAILIGKFTNVNIDGYIGLLVALFIAWSGIKIFKETVSKLIGQAPDEETVTEIKKRLLSKKQVLGIHDLSVYSYGPNKYFASVHIEIDASVDVLVAHELIDEIEREFAKETNILLTGHHDPIVTNDEETNSMRRKVAKIVKKINPDFSMHDFRMVKGPNLTNVIFEVATTFDSKLSAEEIEKILKEEIAKIGEHYRPVIIVEKQGL